MAWGLMLDGYAQAGLVGLKERDVFADGGFTLSRPVIGRFSLGLGAWGGYQPGIYRMDAGPRLSLQVRPTSACISTGGSGLQVQPCRVPGPLSA